MPQKIKSITVMKKSKTLSSSNDQTDYFDIDDYPKLCEDYHEPDYQERNYYSDKELLVTGENSWAGWTKMSVALQFVPQ